MKVQNTLTRIVLIGTLAASVGLTGCSGRLPFSSASAQNNQTAKAQKPDKGQAIAKGQKAGQDQGSQDQGGQGQGEKGLKKAGKKGGNGAAATSPISTRTP